MFSCIVASCDDASYFFAGCIHDCINRSGVDDDCLIRLIVARSEVDLADVGEAYAETYNKQLRNAIESKTSGDYRKLLLAISQ